MKRLMVALALVAPAVAAHGVVRGADETMVVPRDTTPFTVKEDDTVRLTGRGIAGSKIEAKVTGPAKLDETTHVSERVKGKPVLGASLTEFEIKPTGKGKVTVQITVTPPQPDAEPKVTEYEFEVE